MYLEGCASKVSGLSENLIPSFSETDVSLESFTTWRRLDLFLYLLTYILFRALINCEILDLCYYYFFVV